MNYTNKSLFSHSKNYLLADFFNKGIVFLTIPILTRLLTPDEYGLLAIVTSIINIFTILIGMNFHGAINRKYLEFDDDFKKFLSSNLFFLFMTNMVLFSLGYIFREKLAGLLSIDSLLVILALIISSFGFYIQIGLSYLQASQQSSKYAILSVTQTFITTILMFFWIYNLNEARYLGKLYSQIITTTLFSFFVLFRLLKLSEFSFQLKHIKYSIYFGVPLIPHALSGFILAQFDRIIINQVSGSFETGLYSFAYNVGMIMMIAVGAIGKAQGPVAMKLYKGKEYSELQKLADNNSKVIFIIALFLILFSKELVMIMASDIYIEALSIVPIIVISYVMMHLYGIYIFFPTLYKKTFRISIFTFIAGFTNIALNYLFIPKYGFIAAAWTTLASYILLFVLHYINTIYIMKEKLIRFFPIFKNFILLIFFTIFYLKISISNILLSILFKIIFVLLFGLIINIWSVINELKK